MRLIRPLWKQQKYGFYDGCCACLGQITRLMRIIIIITINNEISVAFSPKTARTHNTQKDDMFGR